MTWPLSMLVTRVIGRKTVRRPNTSTTRPSTRGRRPPGRSSDHEVAHPADLVAGGVEDLQAGQSAHEDAAGGGAHDGQGSPRRRAARGGCGESARAPAPRSAYPGRWCAAGRKLRVLSRRVALNSSTPLVHSAPPVPRVLLRSCHWESWQAHPHRIAVACHTIEGVRMRTSVAARTARVETHRPTWWVPTVGTLALALAALLAGAVLTGRTPRAGAGRSPRCRPRSRRRPRPPRRISRVASFNVLGANHTDGATANKARCARQRRPDRRTPSRS